MNPAQSLVSHTIWKSSAIEKNNFQGLIAKHDAESLDFHGCSDWSFTHTDSLIIANVSI